MFLGLSRQYLGSCIRCVVKSHRNVFFAKSCNIRLDKVQLLFPSFLFHSEWVSLFSSLNMTAKIFWRQNCLKGASFWKKSDFIFLRKLQWDYGKLTFVETRRRACNRTTKAFEFQPPYCDLCWKIRTSLVRPSRVGQRTKVRKISDHKIVTTFPTHVLIKYFRVGSRCRYVIIFIIILIHERELVVNFYFTAANRPSKSAATHYLFWISRIRTHRRT